MTNVPRAVPDELAKGLVIRLCRLNGITDPALAMRGLVDAQGHSAVREPAWLDLLAQAHEMSSQAFVANHTLVPFWRAVRRAADCGSFGTVRNGDIVSSRGSVALSMSSQSMSFCPDCVAEDMAFWGYSYWRRSLQLPGLVLCAKHEVGLRMASTVDWKTLPKDAERDSRTQDAEVIKAARNNPVIQRYAEISAGLVQRARPVSTAWMVHILKRRLHLRQASTGKSVRRLSHVASELIRGPWQERFFSEIDRDGDELSSFDRTCSDVRVPYSTAFYVLALAVLFDSADDAMAEVDNLIVASFLDQENKVTDMESNGLAGNLPAAARAFFNGASVMEAAGRHAVPVNQLEELLRATATPLTKLMTATSDARLKCRIDQHTDCGSPRLRQKTELPRTPSLKL